MLMMSLTLETKFSMTEEGLSAVANAATTPADGGGHNSQRRSKDKDDANNNDDAFGVDVVKVHLSRQREHIMQAQQQCTHRLPFMPSVLNGATVVACHPRNDDDGDEGLRSNSRSGDGDRVDKSNGDMNSSGGWWKR